MLYLKIMQGDTVITAEAHENPVYINRQTKNNILVRCSEVHAQGILSLDGSTVYQLDGKTSLDLDDELTAYPIYGTEYDAIINSQTEEEDTEDESPEVPEGTDESTILTRAELTARVAALEDELQAAKILLGVE